MPSTALEKLEVKRAALRKKIFGAPVDWAKVFARTAPKPNVQSALAEETFLREALASGPRAVLDVRAMAAEKGLLWSRVRRAVDRLEAIARPTTPGRWEWSLPGAPTSKPIASKSGRTKIVNARKQFDRKFNGALRSLGLQAKTMRASVWIEGDEAHFFDLALEKGLARFVRFKRDVLARAERRNRK